MVARGAENRGRDNSERNSINSLIGSLSTVVQALKQPGIEAKVCDYFVRHPHNGDPIYIAAVACAFQFAGERRRGARRTPDLAWLPKFRRMRLCRGETVPAPLPHRLRVCPSGG